ncbi:MAG: hypothetical protein KJO21_11345 [Verrucomicrobiae bacterium]|nr:hypothetical protein [Verrucomicrobiae bacterium]NNJ42882.1 hypothetical protein [Akkermansiaceae bacterium]
MADSLWMRLREVRWEQFTCTPAPKKSLPKMLENLASRKEARAMKASHELWVALCSEGIQPAAEPCLPFLIEILGISEAAVQGEILDLLLQFTQLPNDTSAQEWQKYIRMMLHQQHRYFTKLSHSRDAIIADKAHQMLELI